MQDFYHQPYTYTSHERGPCKKQGPFMSRLGLWGYHWTIDLLKPIRYQPPFSATRQATFQPPAPQLFSGPCVLCELQLGLGHTTWEEPFRV